MKKIIFILMISIAFLPFSSYASEVIPETNAKVIVREHPKTGKPYVVITSDALQSQSFFPQSPKFSRPDYRLLDPKVKSGQIPYDGPYSDSKRIYIFAASLATLGTVGIVAAAAMPVAATATATSGGGAYLAAGSAVAAGTAGVALASNKSNPQKDNFTQASESKSIYKEQSNS